MGLRIKLWSVQPQTFLICLIEPTLELAKRDIKSESVLLNLKDPMR